MKYALVFWPDSSEISVIKTSSIPSSCHSEPGVGDIVVITYGKKKYNAKILKFSEDFQWLDGLVVTLDGDIVESTKKKGKKMPKTQRKTKNPKLRVLKELSKKSIAKPEVVAKYPEERNIKKNSNSEESSSIQPLRANADARVVSNKNKQKDGSGESKNLEDKNRHVGATSLQSLLPNTDVELLHNYEVEISQLPDDVISTSVPDSDKKKAVSAIVPNHKLNYIQQTNSSISSGSQDDEDKSESLKPLPVNNSGRNSREKSKSMDRIRRSKNAKDDNRHLSGISDTETELQHNYEVGIPQSPDESSLAIPTTAAAKKKAVVSPIEPLPQLNDIRQTNSICPEMVARITVMVLTELKQKENATKLQLLPQGTLISEKHGEIRVSSPCPKMVELHDGSEVYIDERKRVLILRWARNPKYMIRALMLHLVGAEELRQSTARGMTTCPNKGGKTMKAIPENILLAVKNFIDENGVYQMSDADYHRVINQQCSTLRNPKKPSSQE